MRFTRGDVYALAGAQHKLISADFDRQTAAQDVKELVCSLVIVANFRCARRHAFLNDAQARGLD
jgi:hypothetical protein